MRFRSAIARCGIGGWLLWLGIAPAAFGVADADLVVLGDVRTMADARPRARGLAVRDGTIAYVGTAAEARKRLRQGGRLIELAKGQTVLPGLIDSHVHMLEAGLMSQRCALSEADTATKDRMLAAIAKCAASRPDLAWVLGSGWPPTLFDKGEPAKTELDAVIADRPAVFYGQDGHSAWLNTAALAAAGIRKETPDPVGGRIVRDAAGEPAGTLLESAVDLVEAGVPKASRETLLAGLDYGQKHLHSFGITLVQDANVEPGHLEIYHAAAKSGLLTMKVVAAQATDPTRPASQVDELVRRRERHAHDRLTAGTAKVFVDGVLESRTAALLGPYEGGGNERGILRWESGALKELVTRLDREGFQVHMHVIGDRAVREALDAIAAARAANGASGRRHQLAHLQLVDPADVPRVGKLGVIANFQPYWMFADEWISRSTIPLIGERRANRMYPINSVAKGGARIAAGSDWPVSTPNPFLAIEVGITRESPKSPHGAPWIPGERVTLARLLAAYTIAGAYANHRERDTGSLEAGKAADFIVIDRDLFAIRPHEIGTTRVLCTFVDGRPVYEDRPGTICNGRRP